MASAIVHICVAKELSEKMKLLDERQLYLGAIAPDLSTELNLDRKRSHFVDTDSEYPNIERFIGKYKEHITDPFVMGYFIHIFTDMLWVDFLKETVLFDKIYNNKGQSVLIIDKPLKEIIYDDYTSLNATLIDKYDIGLSVFYEEIFLPNPIIEEIPIDKLKVIVDKTSAIIYNASKETQLLLDEKEIIDFINSCAKKISKYLIEM